jgi:DNA-directed RNA polymerase specialized sigma24 family protein
MEAAMTAKTEPLRLRARLALARSLAPRDATASRAHPDAGQIARVNAAIRQLPEPQREVFLAVRLDDRSLGEIATHMDIALDEAEREFIAALLQIDHALRR